jgi:hypothetical protein
LPDAAPGPFAPVPAKLTGPELPAKPMEPKAPVLKDCANAAAVLKNLLIKLTDDQKRILDANRFLLIPIESTAVGEALPESDDDKQWSFTSDEMLSAFVQLGGDSSPESRKPCQTRLVTPDLVLHAWHRGFSRTLEHIEQRRLHDILASFLDGTLANARELRAKADGPSAERLAWTEARFAAAWILLGPPSPPDPKESDNEDQAKSKRSEMPDPSAYLAFTEKRLAQAGKHLPPAVAEALAQEIHLILDAKAMVKSPLFGMYDPTKPADYTQYKPRSHYTKTPTLGGYFRAMMFLGRNGYTLHDTDAIGDALLASLVMARTPEKGAPPLRAWKELMEITGFFAGQSDDVTYPELRAWTTANLGSPAIDVTTALSPDNLAKLSANMTKLRPPLIVSSAHADQTTSPDSDPPSFRIFGQRFTWDARVLDRLTRGAPQEMPSAPSCVMIPAAFGDSYAEKISRAYLAALPANGAAYAAEFDKRIPEIRKELAGVGDNEWFASMASKQLHVISTLARPRNEQFPAFMRNDAFQAKNITSMLGSFTELKHDTVLYAKQVYAEMGDGGENEKIPPPPHGLVQPDVAFWREMERLAIFASDGFARHKLLPDAAEEFSRFHVFAKAMTGFRKIAEKEIAGAKLTEKDWEIIRTTDLSGMAAPILPHDEPKPGDGKCALATDVLTDAAAGQILQEALGRPYVMLALVGGQDGNRMVVGLAYNYFEFTRPLGQGRLTDEEWQEGIYKPNPTLPAKASWHPPVSAPVVVKPDPEN